MLKIDRGVAQKELKAIIGGIDILSNKIDS